MIRSDTEALSVAEGRRVGQPGHRAAQKYLQQRMADEGLLPFSGESFRLEYFSDDREFCNLAGVIPGSDPNALPILIGAHYDGAVDGPCSDDNAASVALILSLCRQITSLQLQRSVIAVFFDAEEPPYFHTENMGSQRFADDYCSGTEFAAVLILDAIAHDFRILNPVVDTLVRRLRQFLFIIGAESHSLLPEVVKSTAYAANGIRLIPTLNRYIPDTSDHMPFRKTGQPYLFISRGRGEFTHTRRDNLDWINWDALERIAPMILHIIKELNSATMEQGRFPVDPWQLEISLLKKAAGLLLKIAAPVMGLGKLSVNSRADLDLFAARLNRAVKL